MTTTEAPSTTRRAGVYLRISEDRTGREAGVKRQEQDCRELAQRLGWEVADYYTDNGISAYNGKRRRPEYDRLKTDLEAGRIDAVIAWHPDRLYRQARELEAVIDLIATTKAKVATVQTGDVDLATPNGRLVARIGASVAQHESEHKGERVRAWHRQRAEGGHPNGGRRPFGFRPDRVTHDPTEAALIREAATRLLAGEKRFAIIEDWNRRGVATVTGVPWTSTAFVGMLRSPRVAGLRQHNSRTHPAVWEPILPPDDWEAVKASLKTGGRPPGRPASYPLSGILRCGLCGTGLVGNKTTAGVRVYRCPTVQQHGKGCGKIGRNAAAVEAHVAAVVIEALSGPALDAQMAAVGSDGSRDALAALAALEDRLARLKGEYAVEGLWSKQDFVRQKTELEARIGEAAGRIGAANGAGVLSRVPGGDLEGWWATATAAEVRQLVGLVVERIDVHPAGRTGARFDPTKVEIIWKA